MKKTFIRIITAAASVLLSNGMFAQTAQVQVIHNCADAAGAEVDVYVNGNLTFDNFAFRTSTAFLDLPAGVPLSIAIAPGTSTNVSQAFSTTNLTLTSGNRYVVVANGIASPTGYSPAPAFTLNAYNLGTSTGVAPAGNTGLLVVHGSTDAPTVDVGLAAPGSYTELINDLGYSTSAPASSYLNVPTSDYRLQIRTADGVTGVAEFGAPLQTLSLGTQSIVVVASGFLNPANNSGGPGFGLYVALPSGGDLVALPNVGLSPARVQIIHNAADAAAASVDVYLNNAPAPTLDNFAFRTATPFIDFPAATDVEIDIAGGNSTGPNPAVFTQTVNVPTGTYIIVANGIVSPTGYSPAPAFGLDVFPTASESALDNDVTDVLVYHGSTDAPTVDVVSVTTLPSASLVNDASFGDFAGYLNLPTADYSIQVRLADGTTPVAQYGAPLQTLGLGGEALTVLASGFLNPANNSNGAAFGLYVALSSGGALIPLPSQTVSTARVQAIHNCPDAIATEVDVYINDELALDNFAFRTASPFVEIPAGAGTIKIAAPNSTSSAQAIFTKDINTVGGQTYFAVASGITNPAGGYNPYVPFDILLAGGAQESATNVSNTDVRVLHGATDAPTVDVANVTSLPSGSLVNDASYGDFTGYLNLPTADYQIQVRLADGTTPVAQYGAPLQTLGLNGQALLVLASGFLNPAVNNNGAAFGLYVALPSGGALIPLPTSTISTARVQAIHNSADAIASEVDVYINDALAIDNFAFRTASPFVEIPAGAGTIKIAAPNSTSSAQAIFTKNINTVGGQTYFAVASGITNPNGGYNPYVPFDILLADGALEAAGDANNTDVRVFHGSTDAPTVDVKEVTGPLSFPTIVDDASYGDFTPYLNLPTADYFIQVRTSDGIDAVAEYGAPLQTLALDGQALLVLASGFLNPTVNNNGAAFGLYVALPSGGNLIPLPSQNISTARVQVIHNAADPAAAQVDVVVNGATIADNFAFRSATPFVDLKAGVPYTIDIKTPDGVTTVSSTPNVTLAGGERYVVIAQGVVGSGFETNADIDADNNAFKLFVKDGAKERAASNSTFEFIGVHGSTDAPKVDIIARNVATLLDNVSYGDISASYIPVPASSYILDVTPAADNNTVVVSYDANLTGLDGKTGVVFASGFLTPANDNNGPAFSLCFALNDGTTGCFSTVTSVEENSVVVNTSVYPNPANVTTTFEYTLKEKTNFTLRIVDVTGKVIENIYKGNQAAGIYRETVDVSNYAAGVYFVQVTNGVTSFSKKLVITK